MQQVNNSGLGYRGYTEEAFTCSNRDDPIGSLLALRNNLIKFKRTGKSNGLPNFLKLNFKS